MVQDVHLFDTQCMEWQKFEIESISNSFPRFNHTCVAYKHYLYLFAGEKITGNSFHTRACVNDMKVLDTRKAV